MTKEIINYDVTDAAIEALNKRLELELPSHSEITIDDIPRLKEAKKEPAALRIAIEKKRVKLNEEAQAHIKNVNAEAKRVQALVNPIEDAYIKAITNLEQEIQRQAAELQAKEAARIAAIKAKIEKMRGEDLNLLSKTSDEIEAILNQYNEPDTFDYAEFAEEAAQTRIITTMALGYALVRMRDIEENEKKIAEEKAKLAEEKAAFEHEKAKAGWDLNNAPAATIVSMSPPIEDNPAQISLFATPEKVIPVVENPAPWNKPQVDILDPIDTQLHCCFSEILNEAAVGNLEMIISLANRGIYILSQANIDNKANSEFAA